MFTQEFLRQQLAWLRERRKHKIEILRQGGQQALSHSRKDIVRIDLAIKRIKNGQYGLCTDCGCPIEVGRLKAIPEAPFCISCATRIEMQ